ncbi:DMT family transporter [Gulbenkiania mobilis]|uniref:Threonine/homoserine efflux transporter RhtA n=1 Tax=Gulbenkiania mobilis TaxID=397457 RepID=A0ABY2CZC8_GULMO|nr:threonine/homoserine efflux transporter RhtA [Gulbenkiania mobilis]
MSSSTTGALEVLGAAAAFGAMAVFARWAYADGVSPATLLFLRFLLAALVLVPWVVVARLAWPRGRALLALFLMGALGYAGMSACYFNALNHASAGTVALLLYLFPAIVLLLSAVLFKERLTGRRLLTLALALAGLAITVGTDLSARPLGLLLGVGSALIYALYILAGSRFAQGTHPLAASAVVIASAAACNGLQLLMGAGFQGPESLKGWAASLAMALLCTVVAITLFLKGLEKVGATRASLISTAEPVVTIVLAWILLGEHLSGLQLAGGVLILVAVALSSGEKSTTEGPVKAA